MNSPSSGSLSTDWQAGQGILSVLLQACFSYKVQGGGRNSNSVITSQVTLGEVTPLSLKASVSLTVK